MDFEQFQQFLVEHKRQTIVVSAFVVLLCMVIVLCRHCGSDAPDTPQEQKEQKIEDGNLVRYPGRTFDYRIKFSDLHAKQHAAAVKIGLPRPPKDRADAASMRKQLVEIKTNKNYIVDDLTHSVPYLVPCAKRELDSIGVEWADILKRNGLPHYRFYVTSVLRTQEDIKYLQRSGNINSITQSCHCYGTTFDLAYMRYDKVTRTRDYMHEDNLKLVLGQVLLNHQRAGKIYVKYEAKQSCFHITVRK